MFQKSVAYFLILTIVLNFPLIDSQPASHTPVRNCLSPGLNANCAVQINSDLATTPVWRASLSSKVNVNVVKHEDWNKIAAYVNEHSGKDYNGDFFYCADLKINKNTTEIFVTNSSLGRFSDIERDSFWQQRREITEVLSEYLDESIFQSDNISKDQFIRSIITQCNILKTPAGTLNQTMQEFLSISQKNIEEHIDALNTRETKYDFQKYAKHGVNFEEYSHCLHFGFIYQQQINWVKKLLASFPGDKLMVIDDAAGSGHFLLALAKTLEVFDESRLAVVGTDIKDVDISFAITTFKNGKYPDLPRQWLVGPEFDVTATGYHRRMLEKTSGLIKIPHRKMLVLNHVIEHLNGVDPAEYIAGRLEGTDVMSVSIPLHDPPETSLSSHCCEYIPGSLGGYRRISADIPMNERKVGLQDLASHVLELAGENFDCDLSAANAGLLFFYRKNPGLDLVNKSQQLFGADKIEALRAVYQSSWGRSIYPYEKKQAPTTPPQFLDVLKTLVELYEKHPHHRDIIDCIATRLGFTKGVTDAANWAKYFTPDSIRTIFDSWRQNQDQVLRVAEQHGFGNTVLTPFLKTYAQWKTFLDFEHKAQSLTGHDNVCSFSGIADSVRGKYTEAQIAQREKQARFYYELADFIALGKEFELMRINDQQVLDAINTQNSDFLLDNTLSACLFGQGQFVLKTNALLQYTTSMEKHPDLQKIFPKLLACLENGYHTLADLNAANLQSAKTSILKFKKILKQHKQDHDTVNFERVFRSERQKTMRAAETYLLERERQYANYTSNILPDYSQLPQKLRLLIDNADNFKNSAQSYNAAVEFLLQSIETATDNKTFRQCLDIYSALLLKARKQADESSSHDYRFLSLAIEYVGFYKLRYLSQRHRLYGFEAYAERLLSVAKQMNEQGNISRKNFDGLLEIDEFGLWVQKWIFSYGPRRSVMFGCKKAEHVKALNADNRKTLLIDEKIHQIISTDPNASLFGTVESGYTEKLRTLAFAGNEQVLDDLINNSIPANDIADFLDSLNPFNPEDRTSTPLKAAAGVHVHNALKSDTAETMLALRELDWPKLQRVFASTSSSPELAEFERNLAVKFGVSRLAIGNRQLLKAGNQNRTVINLPCDAYLTMDDDFRASPMALMHACAKLQNDPHAAYIQYPHTYRALSEPGHTMARHDNALYLFIFSVQYGPIFERTGFFFPLGTATVYRKAYWDSMGGVGVSPDANLIGEDLFVGLMSTMKASTGKIRWTHGIYPLETAIIGDGVDYKGTAKQQERYAESDSRLLRFVWLPFWLKNKNWQKVSLKRLAIGALVILHYLVSSSYAVLFLFAAPIAEILGVNTIEPSWWYTFSFFASFVCSVTIWRSWGCSARETLASTRLLQFGCFTGMLKGAWVGLFTKPKGLWHASKSGKSENKTKLIHIAIAAITLGGAIAGWASQRMFITPVFLTVSLTFISLFFYDKLAPDNIEEKTNALLKDSSARIRARNRDSLLLNPVALWVSFAVQVLCTAILVVTIPGFAYVPMSIYVFAGIFFSLNSIMFARKNYINPEKQNSGFIHSTKYSSWKEHLKNKRQNHTVIAKIKNDRVSILNPALWNKIKSAANGNILDFLNQHVCPKQNETVILKTFTNHQMEVFTSPDNGKTLKFEGTVFCDNTLVYKGYVLSVEQAA